MSDPWSLMVPHVSSPMAYCVDPIPGQIRCVEFVCIGASRSDRDEIQAEIHASNGCLAEHTLRDERYFLWGFFAPAAFVFPTDSVGFFWRPLTGRVVDYEKHFRFVCENLFDVIPSDEEAKFCMEVLKARGVSEVGLKVASKRLFIDVLGGLRGPFISVLSV